MQRFSTAVLLPRGVGCRTGTTPLMQRLIGALGVLTVGCAAQPSDVHPSAPRPPRLAASARAPIDRAATSALPKRNEPDATPPLEAPTPEPDGPPLLRGDACLRRLEQLGVRYRPTELARVETPVTLTGPIGELRLDPEHLRVDCSFLLALHAALPVLRRHGVTRLRHWGGHKDRLTASGRRSLHAFGLAIDVYEVVGLHGAQRVLLDYRRDLGCESSAPTSDAPLLNRLACDLGSSGVFSEVLTPFSDDAHVNHLHLAVPLPPDRSEERDPDPP